MLEYNKTIFNDEYVVFNDTTTNKKGIIDIYGNIMLDAKYDHIYNSVGDWAIISKRHTINNMDAIFYGIIGIKDTTISEVISPIYGYDSYLEMENIISRLNENKNGIPPIKTKMIKILKYKNQIENN